MSTHIDLLTKSGLRPSKAVFEIGAHDGTDTAAMSRAFGVPIYGFEPNPDAIRLWRENTRGAKDVHLIEKAVSETDGEVTFFAIDTEKYSNIGASGLKLLDFSKRPAGDPEKDEGRVQKGITVQSTRLDTFIQETGIKPDVLCLDCQESELGVLRSMGGAISSVNVIVAECTFTPTYKGGCTYHDVESYLSQHGFKFVTSSKRGNARPKPKFFDRFRKNPRFNFFDVVFARA